MDRYVCEWHLIFCSDSQKLRESTITQQNLVNKGTKEFCAKDKVAIVEHIHGKRVNCQLVQQSNQVKFFS